MLKASLLKIKTDTRKIKHASSELGGRWQFWLPILSMSISLTNNFDYAYDIYTDYQIYKPVRCKSSISIT